MKAKFFLQGIKYSFIKIYTMKTMKLSLILLIATFAVACGQKADDTFDKVITFNYGFRFSPTGPIYTSLPSIGVTYWSDVLSKPLTFPPIAHTHDYAIDLTNKPGTIQLAEALGQLGYLPIPGKTTAEINAIVVPAGKGGIVRDATLDCYKVWSNGVWKVLMTNQ